MTLQEKQNQIQSLLVNRSTGFGSPITYYGLGQTPVTVNANVQDGHYAFSKNEGKFEGIVGDYKTIYTVFLTVAPKRMDEVMISSKKWYVMDFVGENPYTLLVSTNRYHDGSRSARRDI